MALRMKDTRISRAALTIAVLVAGLAALILFSYRPDIAAARARVSSASQVVNTPCGLIEYAAVGKGRPVLVVHGAGGGFDQSLDFGRILVDKGFRVIAPSRFGYLRTPLPLDASPMAQADAHACLLDALNLPRVAVLGGSAGAPSAMQLCLRHPDRCPAMVLLFPIAFAPHPAGEPQEQSSALAKFVMNTTLHSDFFFWTATQVARDTMIEAILATPLLDFHNATPDEKERVLQVLRNILPITEREKGIWNDAAISASIPRYELERFAVPTLVISAENDLFGTYRGARYTAQHIRGARFVGYPTGGHLLVGHQEEVWSEVIGLLKEAGGQGLSEK
ncbi:MAG: alpha/beta hydrolase [Acidobacteria bacterium]|nr:alpha/beta hydrolase [Acidobacteriota bacterium]